ncbi:MAG: class I SAM-dependent methyltransferase [Rhodoglobus sp.]
MTEEHYFSALPSGELKARTIQVQLAGRDVALTTANGVFSPERVDPGTRVLLSNACDPPTDGNFLDLGCGWGPVALTLALTSPQSTVWAVDVNQRALSLVHENARKMSISNIRAVTPDDVPEDMTFTTIWSNPPIRVGKIELHGMLKKWIPRLESGADAWLVVQRNLGADSLHRWLETSFSEEFSVRRAATSKGYRVLQARRQ